MPGPEVTGWQRNARRYFTAFVDYPDDWNQPLCGRLRTTAINGRLTDYYWLNKCPDCERIATERGLRFDSPNAIRVADPWHHIDHDLRETTLDPVTGR